MNTASKSKYMDLTSQPTFDLPTSENYRESLRSTLYKGHFDPSPWLHLTTSSSSTHQHIHQQVELQCFTLTKHGNCHRAPRAPSSVQLARRCGPLRHGGDAGDAVHGVQRDDGPQLLPDRAPVERHQQPLHLRPLLRGQVPGQRQQVPRPRQPLPLPRRRRPPLPRRRRRAAGLPAPLRAQHRLPLRRRRHAQHVGQQHPPRPAGRGRADAAVGDPDQPADLRRRPAGRRRRVVRARRARCAHGQQHQALQRLALALHQSVGAARGQEVVQGVQVQAASPPRQPREGAVRRHRRRDGPQDGARWRRRGRAGGRRGDGGPGRRGELHNRRRGRGGGAHQPRREQRVLRDTRHRGRVRGECGGAQEQEVRHDDRRRHRAVGDHRQPERRRRLDDLQLRDVRCSRDRVRGGEHDVPEHGRPSEAPGGGAPVRRGPVDVLPVQLRGVPGHAVHALPPAVLPLLRHLRHRRLRVRQRRRRVPGLQPLLPPADAGAEQHRHGAGPHGPEPEHGHHLPGLHARGGARPRRQLGVRRLHLPRPAVEELLPDGDHAVGGGRAGGPRRVDAVGRRLRAGHAVLRRVQQHRARGGHEQAGVVAGVPRAQQRRRRRQLHRREHGARGLLAAPDRGAFHERAELKRYGWSIRFLLAANWAIKSVQS